MRRVSSNYLETGSETDTEQGSEKVTEQGSKKDGTEVENIVLRAHQGRMKGFLNPPLETLTQSSKLGSNLSKYLMEAEGQVT